MSTPIQESVQVRKSRILLVDDDEAEYHLVSELLRDKDHLFELKWVESLTSGIESLKEEIDVILLDLFLTDSQGLDTYKRMKSHVKDIPIVILSGLEDESVAVDAIQQGAQDFLVKDHVDGKRLSRVIQYAIKRHEIQKDPKNNGLIDAFTGLHNRKGFLMMVEQHLKAAQRTKNGFFICFAILNGLEKIIDVHGKAEGDHALLTAAEILRESFRSTDLIARMGPDEFAILTSEQENCSPKVISSRIRKNQKYYNAQFNRYRLSLSMCATHFKSAENLSVNDLSTKVDHVFASYKTNQNLDDFFVAN